MAFFSTPTTEEPGKFLGDTRIWEADVAIRKHLLRLVDITGSLEYKVYVEPAQDERSKAERHIAVSTREIVGALWPLFNEVIKQLTGMRQQSAALATSRASRNRSTLQIALLSALSDQRIILDDAKISGYALHRLSSGKRTTTPGTRQHCTSIQHLVQAVPTLLSRIERNLKALQDGKAACAALVKEDRQEADWDEKYSGYRGLGGGMIYF